MLGKSEIGNIEEVLQRLKELEKENKELKTRQRYGLIWEDSPEELDSDIIVPVLREVTDKRIELDEGGGVNYLLEGDNYHSLKVLQHTHKGKVDVIYIDPPYNTGNEFVYNDKIVDKEDSFRHSKWLSFMSKRLKLAKNLMTDDGVIFVSIDDNEQAQLKLLMDSIFGEKNFVNNIIIKTKASSGVSGKSTGTGFRKGKENMFIYTKNKEAMYLNKIYEYEKISELVERYKEEQKGYYYTRVIKDYGKRIKVGTTDRGKIDVYKHEGVQLTNISNLMKEENLTLQETYNKYINDIFMVTNAQSSLFQRVSNEFSEKGELYSYDYIQTKGRDSGKLVTKFIWNKTLVVWLKDTSTIIDKQVYNQMEKNDLWTDISYGRLDLEGGVDFKNGKKPLKMIKDVISLHPNKNATVLDFFAGSGTTGHAVMELNKEDGGNRKFILCTNNEVSEEKVRQHFIEQGLLDKNTKTAFNKFKEENEGLVAEFMLSDEYKELGIARSVTYERNKKVIEGYTTPKGKEVDGIPSNLRYLETVAYDRDSITNPLIRLGLLDEVKVLHEMAYPSTEYDNYYFKMYDKIEIESTGKPITVLLGGNEEENEVMVDEIREQGYTEVIYRTIENYV